MGRKLWKNWLERSCLVVNGRVFTGSEPASRPLLRLGRVFQGEEQPGRVGFTIHYEALRFKIVLTEANKQQWLELLGGNGLGSEPVGVSIAMVDLFELDKTEIMPTAINPSFARSARMAEGEPESLDRLAHVAAAGLLLPAVLTVPLLCLCHEGSSGAWLRTASGTSASGGARWRFGSSSSRALTSSCGSSPAITRRLPARNCCSWVLALPPASAPTSSRIRQAPPPPKPRGSDILTQEEMDLDTAAELQARVASESQKTARLTGADALRSQRRVAEFKRRAAYYKAGWGARLWRSFNDLISEANDGRPSFHRFQMIGWNLAFGVIFVRAVYYKLAMPEFSNDQLLLMGISNGTYLGFKWSVSKPDKDGK